MIALRGASAGRPTSSVGEIAQWRTIGHRACAPGAVKRRGQRDAVSTLPVAEAAGAGAGASPLGQQLMPPEELTASLAGALAPEPKPQCALAASAGYRAGRRHPRRARSPRPQAQGIPAAIAPAAPPPAQGSEAIAAPPPSGPLEAPSSQSQPKFTTEDVVNALLKGRTSRKPVKAPPGNEWPQSKSAKPPVPPASSPQNSEAAQTSGTIAVANGTLSKEAAPPNASPQSEPIAPPKQEIRKRRRRKRRRSSMRRSRLRRSSQPKSQKPRRLLGRRRVGADRRSLGLSLRSLRSRSWSFRRRPAPSSRATCRNFGAGANAATLTLRAEPHAPPGLAFADLGSGSSRLSGTPTTPGPLYFSTSSRPSRRPLRAYGRQASRRARGNPAGNADA